MCEIHRLTTNTCLTQVLIFKYHKVMNKIPQLYELCVKIFENDVEKLKKQWFDTIGVD